jgi:hypothetical protein
VSCKDGFQRNVNNKCIMTCGENEMMVQNKCECNNGFQRGVNLKHLLLVFLI